NVGRVLADRARHVGVTDAVFLDVAGGIVNDLVGQRVGDRSIGQHPCHLSHASVLLSAPEKVLVHAAPPRPRRASRSAGVSRRESSPSSSSKRGRADGTAGESSASSKHGADGRNATASPASRNVGRGAGAGAWPRSAERARPPTAASTVIGERTMANG